MDEIMIAAWNDHVKPNDIVYCLGDFAFHSREKIENLLARLNGILYLIPGNHDRLKKYKDTKINILPPLTTVDINGKMLVLCHYPLLVWENSHYGSWQLYSHVHGTLGELPLASMDVGVDAVGYAPVSFEYVQAHLSAKKKNDPNWCRLLPGAPEEWKIASA